MPCSAGVAAARRTRADGWADGSAWISSWPVAVGIPGAGSCRAVSAGSLPGDARGCRVHPTPRHGEARVDAAHASLGAWWGFPTADRSRHVIVVAVLQHRCGAALPAVQRPLQRDAWRERLRFQPLAWPGGDALARGSGRRWLGQLPAAARRGQRRHVVVQPATVRQPRAGRRDHVRRGARQFQPASSQRAQRAGRGGGRRGRHRTAPAHPEQPRRPHAHAVADLVRRAGARPDRRRQRAPGVLQDVRADRMGRHTRHAAGHAPAARQQRGRSVGRAVAADRWGGRRRRIRNRSRTLPRSPAHPARGAGDAAGCRVVEYRRLCARPGVQPAPALHAGTGQQRDPAAMDPTGRFAQQRHGPDRATRRSGRRRAAVRRRGATCRSRMRAARHRRRAGGAIRPLHERAAVQRSVPARGARRAGARPRWRAGAVVRRHLRRPADHPVAPRRGRRPAPRGRRAAGPAALAQSANLASTWCCCRPPTMRCRPRSIRG